MFFKITSIISFVAIVLFSLLLFYQLKKANENPSTKKLQEKISLKSLSDEDLPVKSQAVVAEKELTLEPKRKLVVLIYGLGINTSLTQEIINKIPPQVWLAFSPYTVRIQVYIASMLKKKINYGIELPLEEVDFPLSTYGSLTLVKDLSSLENNNNFDEILKKVPNAQFLFFGPREVFSYSSEHMKYLIEQSVKLTIKPVFVFQENYLNSFLKEFLPNNNLKMIYNYINIPDNLSKEKFSQHLNEIEGKMQENTGDIVISLKAENHTLQPLLYWLSLIDRYNYRLTGLQDI